MKFRALWVAACAACGSTGTDDLGQGATAPGVYADATAEAGIAARITKVLMIVREPPPAGNGCDRLWSEERSGLAETRCVGSYPETDISSFYRPIAVDKYPRGLDVFLYAFEGQACAAIAGGCGHVVASQGSDRVSIDLSLTATPVPGNCQIPPPELADDCRMPPN